MSLTHDEQTAYWAVYQAYAYAQGATGHATEFRIPDEYFCLDPSGQNAGFDIKKFFQLVADVDEGGIHYWKYYQKGQDHYLMLACTEDDSMTHMGTTADEFHTAAAIVDRMNTP